MRRLIARQWEHLSAHPLERFCDWFFVFYALWTLVWIGAYFANLSFAATSLLFLALSPLSACTIAFKSPVSGQLVPIATSKPRDTVIAFLFVFAGVLLTLVLHRPDADDELYLGMAFSLLAHADQPIQELPAYVAAGELFSWQFSGIGAYEPFRAMVSYLTGLPLLDSYYLVIPSLMSALTVIVTYRLLRELIPKGWSVGLLFFFVVMLAWGDAHRTLANFGFVRMFQGKAVLVSAVVPALFLYYFLARKSTRSGYQYLLGVAALVSGVGFSRGGMIIGPLVLALLGLASINFRTLNTWFKIALIITGISAAAALILVYNSGWSLMNPSQLVYTGGRRHVASTTNWEMIELTMGSGARGIFLLICVATSFLFVENINIKVPYARTLAILFILLLIPWTSNFFAKTIQEYLSWRWMWVAPVPVLASVSVGGAFAAIRQAHSFGAALSAFLIVVIGFTVASPRVVVSKQNWTSVRWPGAKLDGNTIYLRPYAETATVKNGKLKLERFDRGF